MQIYIGKYDSIDKKREDCKIKRLPNSKKNLTTPFKYIVTFKEHQINKSYTNISKYL